MLAKYDKTTHQLVPIAGKDSLVDYTSLSNKPQINGVPLIGNKTTSDLGLFDGDYNSLLNRPTIPAAQIQSDWNQTDNTQKDYIKNKPLVPVQVQSDWNQTDNTQVDFIKNKPTIPAAQIQSDWNQSNTNLKDFIKNKPTIPTTTSQLTNDSGYITKSVNDLVNYTTTSDLNTALAGKQDTLVYDQTPTQGSSNAITSGSLYDVLQDVPKTFVGTQDEWDQLTPQQKAQYEYVSIISELHYLYGFHINGSVADPLVRVTYLEDAVGKTPAHMDYANDVFDYGSWENAFFMPKPCMLNPNGTVAYYLDPDDYTKKVDGTSSDIGSSSSSYTGNAMMEWPKIYMKIVPDMDDPNSASIFIADTKVDNDFTCYQYYNASGMEVNHFYTSIFMAGQLSGSTKFRALSGKSVYHTSGVSNMRNYTRSNGSNWDLFTYSDWMLITALLLLMGKSTNLQHVYGTGLIGTLTDTALNNHVTGSLNQSGMFYGTNDGTHSLKIFGIENLWGLLRVPLLGFYKQPATQLLFKLCYGQEDGSTVDDYNLTGVDYITGPNIVTDLGLSGTRLVDDWSVRTYFTANYFFPYASDNETIPGSSTTYNCVGFELGLKTDIVAFFGGLPSQSGYSSILDIWLELQGSSSSAVWYSGTLITCR